MMHAEVYAACGVIPYLEIPFYPADWKLHRDAERHLDGRHAVRDRNFGAATARRRRGFSLQPLPHPWGDRGRMAADHSRAGYHGDDLWRRHAAKASQPRTVFFNPFLSIFVEPK